MRYACFFCYLAEADGGKVAVVHGKKRHNSSNGKQLCTRAIIGMFQRNNGILQNSINAENSTVTSTLEVIVEEYNNSNRENEQTASLQREEIPEQR